MANISLQEAYDQARRWIESDDPERAIGLAQYILDHYPNNLEAYRVLGEAYLASRQLEQAQAAFERVLESDPENIPAHVGLGITYERQNRLDRAIPEFEQAWEIKPEMAELRSQLLRLYTEAWGSEHAQLRLRGGGLARLYAKGHMLPQAIAEFRKIIDGQPERMDARVALAEALWRNSQEDEASDLSRKLLGERPTLLKPNLLLGYMQLASGQSGGQQYWNAASDMDPYQTVAHALFDTLPSTDNEQPTIEEWDEQAWRRQRDQEQHELDATRPIPVPSASDMQEQPVAVAAPVVPSTPPLPAKPAPTSPFDQDDFLAGLLGTGAAAAGASAFASSPPDTSATSDDAALEPFSLAELGLSDDDDFARFDEPSAPQNAADQTKTASSSPDTTVLFDQDVASRPAEEDTTDDDLTPFSLADLGLSDDEIASLNDATDEPSDEAPATNAATEPEELDDLTPFSFADLGLSEDEINGLNLDDTTATEQPAPQDGVEDDRTTRAFSLADLGLDDDETSAPVSDHEHSAADTVGEDMLRGEAEPDVPQTASAEAPATSEPANIGDVAPFSFADLGLSEDEINSLNLDQGSTAEQLAQAPNSQPNESDSGSIADQLAHGTIEPFSFADLGLSDDEIANLNDLGTIEEPAAEEQPVPAEQPTSSAPDSLDDGLASGEIKPFSFADLGLSEDEIASLNLDETTAEPATLQATMPDSLDDGLASGEIKPFSFADLGLSEDEIASLNEGSTSADQTAETPPNEAVIDTDVQPFSLSDLGLSDEELDSLNAIGDDSARARNQFADEYQLPNNLQPFSLDELDLADSDLDDSGTAATPFSPNSSDAPARPTAQTDTSRMSDADEDAAQASGGYSWQEPVQRSQPNFVSSLNKEDQDENMSIFAKLKQRKQQEPEPVEEPALTDQLDDRMLFSNDEVSLHDEAGSTAAPQTPATPTNTSSEAADLDTGMASGEIQPFSLSDLGLSEEEIAALGLGGTAAIAASTDNPEAQAQPVEQSASEAPDQATSTETENVSDGLASGDIQPFSFADLGLSDDEIASLNLDEPVTETPAAEQPVLDTPENVSDGLASGDIQPFSFADLGLSDDEIASLNLDEPANETPASEQAASSTPENVSDGLASGDIQPFSFADLGLSDDELASLNLDEPATEPAAEQPVLDTPENVSDGLASGDIQPFSFADLGLSDDEIASLNLDETAVESTETTPSTETESVDAGLASGDIQPFSFADLGLSDDEIASLNLDETATEPAAEQPALDTPENVSDGLASGEIQPFSFADLGLSDDEIASLNLDETTTVDTAAANQAADDDIETDLQPFSLNDLGLSDDELDAFNTRVSDASSPQSNLDLTEEDLAGFDFGAPEWTQTAASQPEQPDQAEASPSGTVVDQLFDLGQQQGYVDVADIITAIGPQADESQVESVVQQLQDANIQIRDGDEIIDLTADESEEGGDEIDFGSFVAGTDEPDMTPFSLSELGLSDEEIALLGLGEAEVQPSNLAFDADDTPVEVTPAEIVSPEASADVEAQPETAQPPAQPPVAVPTPIVSATTSAGAATDLPPVLASYISQLESNPQNHVLRLSVARAVGQAGMTDMSVQQYRQLIRQNVLIDVIVDDLRDLIDEIDDPRFSQRLHRLLGDAYTKQGRINEAMEAYSWIAQ